MAPLADFANGTFSIPVYKLAISLQGPSWELLRLHRSLGHFSGATQVKHLVLACAYCDQATPRLTRADLEAELQQRDRRGILAIRYVYAHLSYHGHENKNKNMQNDLLFPMTHRQFHKKGLNQCKMVMTFTYTYTYTLDKHTHIHTHTYTCTYYTQYLVKYFTPLHL